MADQRAGGIEWTDQTWNPIRGCSRISEGCRNCYAELVAARFSGKGLPYEGLAKRTPAGARWTGNLAVIDDRIADPLRWTRPRRIFVNSTSDLFHERLGIDQIARVFAVMYLAHQHTFQVLTKRARRMREVLTSPVFYRLVLDHADAFRRDFPRKELARVGISDPTKHPHRNVWLGVSVEDQKAADERVPELAATPAAVRFLSMEPLLEAVDLLGFGKHLGVISWVIIGGESGRNARPFELDWARELVRQCRTANLVPFVKQLGACASDARNGIAGAGLKVHPDAAALISSRLTDPAGGDIAEWPLELRVREFPR